MIPGMHPKSTTKVIFFETNIYGTSQFGQAGAGWLLNY